MPLPPIPDDRHRRALLILLLLAREAALAPEQVDGPEARVLAGRAVAAAARAHRRSGSARRWMCRYRWTA